MELVGPDIGGGIGGVVGLDGGVGAGVFDPDVAVLGIGREVEVARLATGGTAVGTHRLELDGGNGARQANRVVAAVGAIDAGGVDDVVVVGIHDLHAGGRSGHGLHAGRIHGVRPDVAHVQPDLARRTGEILHRRGHVHRLGTSIRREGNGGGERRASGITLGWGWGGAPPPPPPTDRGLADDHDVGIARREQEVGVTRARQGGKRHGDQIVELVGLHGWALL